MALASSWCRSPSALATAVWTCGTRCCTRRFSRSAASRPSTSAITRLKTSRARSSASALVRGSWTKSVSTGTPPVSVPTACRCSSASALPIRSLSPATLAFHVVHADIVAALLVERIPLASLPLVILTSAHDFQQAFEGREEGRPFVAEIQQHVVMRQRVARRCEHHRSFIGDRRLDETVRDESGGLESPERAVELLEDITLRRIDHEAARGRVRLGGEEAGEAKLV